MRYISRNLFVFVFLTSGVIALPGLFKQVQTVLTEASKQRIDDQTQQQTLMHPFDLLVTDHTIFVADSCFLYRCNTSHVNKVRHDQEIEEYVPPVCPSDIIPESRDVFKQPYCLCKLPGTIFDDVGIVLVGDRKVCLTLSALLRCLHTDCLRVRVNRW